MSRGSALMRSDAFDQQRELRMKEGWRVGGGGAVKRQGFGDKELGWGWPRW